MSLVSEQDLDLLEDYLDGTLPPEESDRLIARLAEDEDLAVALGDAEAARTARAAAWASFEPSKAKADRFSERVIVAARRYERQSRFWRTAGFSGAAAACVVFGVFLGWLGSDRGTSPLATSPGLSLQPQQVTQAQFQPSVVVAPPVATPNADMLGVKVSEIQVHSPSRPSRPMLIVSEVTTSPAQPGAGLEVGDLLLSIDEQRVPNVPTLAAVLGSRSGTRAVRILRDGQVRELAIRFEQRQR